MYSFSTLDCKSLVAKVYSLIFKQTICFNKTYSIFGNKILAADKHDSNNAKTAAAAEDADYDVAAEDNASLMRCCVVHFSD